MFGFKVIRQYEQGLVFRFGRALPGLRQPSLRARLGTRSRRSSLVPAPAASPDWPGMAVLAGLGILGAVLGGILLSRRDQKNA